MDDSRDHNGAVTIGCPHADALGGRVQRVCMHLLYPEPEISSYYTRFTGIGNEYVLVCEQCASDNDIPVENLLVACMQCTRDIEKRNEWSGLQGQPEVRERRTTLNFVDKIIWCEEFPSNRVLAIAPLVSADSAGLQWLILGHDGSLLAMDLTEQRVGRIGKIADQNLDLTKPLSIHVSPGGRMAAVVNTYGQFGTIVDLGTGQVTMRLARDNYYIEHCIFPVAFFEHEGRILIVHATEWNRLDVSDPLTGELLTPRQYIWPEPDPEHPHIRPEHHLDYFHCSLLVSPDGNWIVESGWVWHPLGIVRAWSLRNWMEGNPWESEDGPSLHHFAYKEYYWDGPMCWINNEVIAIWGYGGDEEWQIPAARMFNARTGQEDGWFPGPEGKLVFEKYLFSYSEEKGTAVWDIGTGERLLERTTLHPVTYHPGERCFLSLGRDGSYVVSYLEGQHG